MEELWDVDQNYFEGSHPPIKLTTDQIKEIQDSLYDKDGNLRNDFTPQEIQRIQGLENIIKERIIYENKFNSELMPMTGIHDLQVAPDFSEPTTDPMDDMTMYPVDKFTNPTSDGPPLGPQGRFNQQQNLGQINQDVDFLGDVTGFGQERNEQNFQPSRFRSAVTGAASIPGAAADDFINMALGGFARPSEDDDSNPYMTNFEDSTIDLMGTRGDVEAHPNYYASGQMGPGLATLGTGGVMMAGRRFNKSMDNVMPDNDNIMDAYEINEPFRDSMADRRFVNKGEEYISGGRGRFNEADKRFYESINPIMAENNQKIDIISNRLNNALYDIEDNISAGKNKVNDLQFRLDMARNRIMANNRKDPANKGVQNWYDDVTGRKEDQLRADELNKARSGRTASKDAKRTYRETADDYNPEVIKPQDPNFTLPGEDTDITNTGTALVQNMFTRKRKRKSKGAKLGVNDWVRTFDGFDFKGKTPWKGSNVGKGAWVWRELKKQGITLQDMNNVGDPDINDKFRKALDNIFNK